MKESRVLVVAGCLCLAVAAWNVQARPNVPLMARFVAAERATTTATPVVGIVFHPRDCSGMIDALSFWNEPQRSGEIRVVGLLRGVERGSRVAEKITRGAGLDFPIRTVDESAAGEIRAALGYAAGSLIVVFDARGHVRMTTPLDEMASRDKRDQVLSFARTLHPRNTANAD